MASNGKFPSGGQTLGPLADPEDASDAATKNYVDQLVAAAISPLASVSYVDSGLSGKAVSVHTHGQSDITGLVTAGAVFSSTNFLVALRCKIPHYFLTRWQQ